MLLKIQFVAIVLCFPVVWCGRINPTTAGGRLRLARAVPGGGGGGGGCDDDDPFGLEESACRWRDRLAKSSGELRPILEAIADAIRKCDGDVDRTLHRVRAAVRRASACRAATSTAAAPAGGRDDGRRTGRIHSVLAEIRKALRLCDGDVDAFLACVDRIVCNELRCRCDKASRGLGGDGGGDGVSADPMADEPGPSSAAGPVRLA